MHSSVVVVAAILLLVLCPVTSLNVRKVVVDPGRENLFTPMASLKRYLKSHVENELPKFLMNMSSPLTVPQAAFFSKLANSPNLLSAYWPKLCSEAHMLCVPDVLPSLQGNSSDAAFTIYDRKNFSTYGKGRQGGQDEFKTYSKGENIAVNSFNRYRLDTTKRRGEFASYSTDANLADNSFNNYATSATDGEGIFTSYSTGANSVDDRFKTYSQEANGGDESFVTYSQDANSGDHTFSTYGKDANRSANSFAGYGNGSNVMGSNFNNYGEQSAGENSNFTNYGSNGNIPDNNFRNYGTRGNDSNVGFTNYRVGANVGDGNFQTYLKDDTSGGNASFANYDQSFNGGPVKFNSYGQGSKDPNVAFKAYSQNTSFTGYNNQSTPKFDTYGNSTAGAGGQRVHNKFAVEPGKFFREGVLKPGKTMIMADIRDQTPKRLFLPKTIASKLPFSSSKIREMEKIFNAGEPDSSMSKMLTTTLAECERPSSRGETKRCVSSIEDMVDFATSVLGRKAVVRTTQNTRGHSSTILVGKVHPINGGNATKSVSCHQSLYPYLMYYCHSVPNVRVYEVDILDLKTREKVNTGVALCHLDTSAWSDKHAAFLALGSGPGIIEVCHFIYENDMTWATT